MDKFPASQKEVSDDANTGIQAGSPFRCQKDVVRLEGLSRTSTCRSYLHEARHSRSPLLSPADSSACFDISHEPSPQHISDTGSSGGAYHSLASWHATLQALVLIRHPCECQICREGAIRPPLQGCVAAAQADPPKSEKLPR